MSLKAVRAPDFAETGSYHVETAQGRKVFYRDPESRYWYEDRSGEHYSRCGLGESKTEALARLEQLYGAPSSGHGRYVAPRYVMCTCEGSGQKPE